MSKQNAKDVQVINDGKVLAILSYLSILCIIPLVIQKNNPFVLHHGKQGLVLFVGQVAIFVLHIIFGQWLVKIATFIFGAISLVGIISVLKGNYFKIPVVNSIAEQITL